MTKYILHGGATKLDTADNRKFFKAIAESIPDSGKILVVIFARDKRLWPELFSATRQSIREATETKQLSFELAQPELDVFIKQLNKADAVCMLGGNTHILKKYLEKIPNLAKLWQGKTVAGSSAGALVLARYFYENDDDTYNEGLGILPYKIFCHYSGDKISEVQKLEQFGSEMEVITLPEEKSIFITK